MSRSLEPGIMLLIAEIADPDPDVLDSALGALGGWARIGSRAARTGVNDLPPVVQDQALAGSTSGAAIQGRSAGAQFSPAERDVIKEAGSIIGAPELDQLRAACRAARLLAPIQ